MKNTQKYIKTRGQLVASQRNKLPILAQLSLTNNHKKSTSSSGKDQSNGKASPKQKFKQPSKTKKIKKNAPANKTNNKSKPTKIHIKTQTQSKQNIPPKLNHVKLQKNSFQKKVKIQPDQIKQKSIPIKKEPNSTNKKNNKLTDYQLTLDQQKQIQNSQTNINLTNGIQIKKQTKKKPQSSKSKIKIEVQEDNKQSQKLKIQNQIISKSIKKSQRVKNQQKIIEDIQHLRVNIPINIITESSLQFKKKGRPKKVITQSIRYEQRLPDEHLKLEEFVQNAIKLRKIKSEKQFFESFSRLTQYAQQSWQYGDLGKDLKWTPQRQEILKIGIPIVRGIRKQIQQQQLLNLVI